MWWLCRARLPSGLPHLLFALCFAAGCFVSLIALPERPANDTSKYSWAQDQKADTLRATVHHVQGRPGRTLRILLSDVERVDETGATEKLPGRLVWTWRSPDYRPEPGQAVTVRLKVKPVRGFENPGGWSYEEHWARRGVFHRAYSKAARGKPLWGPRPGSWPWNLREQLRARVIAGLGGEQEISRGGAVIVALLFGDRYFLAQGEMQRMGHASLAHTLALSGLHVGLVAGLGALAAWLAGTLLPALYLRVARQRLAVLTAAPLVAGYVWMGQASPSLTRAAIMFAAWGALLLAGRSRVLLDGLFLALLLILLLDPVSVTDLGLQMSAVAVAGIASLGPAWEYFRTLRTNMADWHPLLRTLGRAGIWAAGLLLVSLAAQLALLPLLARSFGYVSLSLWTNLFWLPALGLAILPLSLAGFLLASLGWPPAATALLQLAAGLQNQLFALLETLSANGLTPWMVCLRPHWIACLGYWGLLTILAARLQQTTPPVPSPSPQPSPRTCGPGTLLLLIALLIVPTGAALNPNAFSQKPSPVSLTLLDVGQGQALVIETPNQDRILIDGGGLWPGFDVGSAVVGPTLTNNRPPHLAGVILTHPDSDHWRGLEHILKHFRVGWFASNGDTPRGVDATRYAEAIAAFAKNPRQLHAGDRIPLADNLRLDVLHPPASYPATTNNRSVVLRLVQTATSNGQTSERGLALLPGDLETSAIKYLLATNTDLSAEVLILPHHGARSSLVPELYRRVNAKTTLASCGYLNYFGFPAQQVRDAITATGATLRTTADEGAIVVRWGNEGP